MPKTRRISVPLTAEVMHAQVNNRVWSTGSEGTVTLGVRNHEVSLCVAEARAVVLDLDASIREAVKAGDSEASISKESRPPRESATGA